MSFTRKKFSYLSFVIAGLLLVFTFRASKRNISCPEQLSHETIESQRDALKVFNRDHKAEGNGCTQQTIGHYAEKLYNGSSKCPAEPWYWEWQRGLRVDKFVYVEVGCNKASDAVMNLRAFTANHTVDLDLFTKHTGLVNYACKPDRGRWKWVRSYSHARANEYAHFCIEAARENVNPVIQASKDLHFDDLGLKVRHAAISSSSNPSTVKFPAIQPGAESQGIDTNHARFREFYDVQVQTVDEFVSSEEIRQLDVLKIDTEGNDPLVLIGAVKSLAHLKPAYVQFENHGIGRWATFQLKDVIDLLDALNYECFWELDSDILIQITSCWSERYAKYKRWSNVACYHREEKNLKRAMDRYAYTFAATR